VNFGKGTVFVLGAGFTRAFLQDSPLLIDHCYGGELRKKFADFPDALAILDAELNDPDHSAKIDIERLMTRLAGGMPYDFVAEPDKPIASNHELDYLLVEVKRAFTRRITESCNSAVLYPGTLCLFARHISQNENHCITFNYDDLLEKSLYQLEELGLEQRWNPETGYGFPCRPSAELAYSCQYLHSRSPMILCKLHGSMNWRIPRGARKPVQANDIWHHEQWWRPLHPRSFDLASLEPLLEEESVIIPPVLTKSGLVQEPVLRIVWSCARSVLREAKRVVFIGYSLPLTDIAAGFLFREGLRKVEQAIAVTVVDFAKGQKESEEKLTLLLSSYRNVFPAITPKQFEFSGADEWLRDNLTDWLYDSRGNAVAFNALGHIVSRDGRFIGTIRGYYPGRQDIWHGIYKGEIVQGNRLLRADPSPTEDRGGTYPPPLPEVPRIPDAIGAIDLPSGLLDIDWTDEARVYATPAGLHNPP
jgi:hypothetical protein